MENLATNISVCQTSIIL